MPLTIVAVALLGSLVMGMSLAAAILLGACWRRPTRAGGRHRRRPAGRRGRARAGLLASPPRRGSTRARLPVPAAGRRDRRGRRSSSEWALADVLYGIVAGDRDRRVPRATGSPRSPSACATASCSHASSTAGWRSGRWRVIYGATEIAGRLRVSRRVRRWDRLPPLRAHARAQPPASTTAPEIVEDVAELALILVLGSCVTLTGLGVPGVNAAGCSCRCCSLVIRPVAVLPEPAAHAESCASGRSSAGSGCAGSARCMTRRWSSGSGCSARGDARHLLDPWPWWSSSRSRCTGSAHRP